MFSLYHGNINLISIYIILNVYFVLQKRIDSETIHDSTLVPTWLVHNPTKNLDNILFPCRYYVLYFFYIFHIQYMRKLRQISYNCTCKLGHISYTCICKPKYVYSQGHVSCTFIRKPGKFLILSNTCIR